ncbi:MAG: tRNA lysidine(34) synthetase TilS [Dehalococcoidales bacterium]
MKRQEYRQPLEKKVLGFIRKHKLVSGQRRLLVAVSGGPDSVCLLHILAGLSEELGITLQAAHLDHQLRGPESEEDALYVSRLSGQLGVPVTIQARDVKKYRFQHRMTLEEAAREVRYSFLAEVAGSIGADCVATGHTANDNAETILMHLIRGAGTLGLTGLQPRSQWRSPENSLTIIRPFLPVSRQETEDYCNKYKLEPRSDSSNLSMTPLRNKIRHQLVPLLETYNPRITDALLRTARIAGDDLAALDGEGDRRWDSIAEKRDGTVVLDKEKLLGLPAGLQRLLLRRAIKEIAGDLKDVEAIHIEAMMDVLSKPAGKLVVLPGGLVFVTEYARYLLAPESDALCPYPPIRESVILKIPGETRLPGWRVTATRINREQMDEGNEFTAYFDAEGLDGTLAVRCRQPGDRFQPLGMGKSKKLGRFMIDEKIPAAWRRRVPVVCSSEQILWVVGWRIDDRVKVTADSGPVLRLEFEQTIES